MTFEERWDVLSKMWTKAPADAEFRQQVLESMARQSQEFREHDVEYGYRHVSSAVIPDGSAPEPEHDFRIHVPSTAPGSPLPHAWIEDWEMKRCSTIDLVGVVRFLLIAGEDGAAWCAAAREVSSAVGVAIDAVTIGHARGDWRDPRLTWQKIRGISSDGAILVRPDRCIAWRSMDASADPAGELASVLRSVVSSPR